MLTAFENLRIVFSELNKTEKEVYIYLHRMCRYYGRNCHPSQDEIGRNTTKKIGARQVRRILNKLCSYGVIVWKKMGIYSNTYIIGSDILKIDLSDPRVLKKLQNVRENVRIIKQQINTSMNSDAKASAESFIEKKEEPATAKFPEWLPKFLRIGLLENFNFKRYGWILKKLKEVYLRKAIENCRWYLVKAKRNITNYASFFFGICLKLLNRQIQEYA